jgi:hypothetical protein
MICKNNFPPKISGKIFEFDVTSVYKFCPKFGKWREVFLMSLKIVSAFNNSNIDAYQPELLAFLLQLTHRKI